MRPLDYGRVTMLALAASVLSGGCESSAENVCELVCECTHCNDFEEERSCAHLEWQADVAESYDCTSEFDDWAKCVEDNGRCNEDEASFTTHEVGSCSGQGETNLDCTLDPSVCAGIANGATCEGGTCKYRACAGQPGPNPPACSSDADCGFGPDRCAEAHDALVKCQADASEVNPLLTQPQPQPPGGPTGGEDF